MKKVYIWEVALPDHLTVLAEDKEEAVAKVRRYLRSCSDELNLDPTFMEEIILYGEEGEK